VAVGKNLKGHEVIELVSDLGGGKTLFVSGLAKGMGSTDVVASPTFTISRIYSTEKLDLHHFDFYRLSDPGIVARELMELMTDKKAIVVLEWSEIVRNILPKNRLSITFKTTGKNSRSLTFKASSQHKYLVADIIVM
jgi:tRNA threonylcarbamoyladenosine biosynthesis protein TsaE